MRRGFTENPDATRRGKICCSTAAPVSKAIRSLQAHRPIVLAAIKADCGAGERRQREARCDGRPLYVGWHNGASGFTRRRAATPAHRGQGRC